MKKSIILLSTFIFSLSFLYAKRTPPPEVPSIIHNGCEYIANYSNGIFKGTGQIIIKSINENDEIFDLELINYKVKKIT